MTRLFIFLVMFLIAGLSFNDTKASCGIKRDIRHINGIWTDKEGVKNNLAALQEQYGNKFTGQDITFSYSYNDGNGMLDLYFQKDVEADPEASRKLAQALLELKLDNLPATIAEQVKADYVKALGDSARTQAVGSNVGKITAQVKANIDAGTKVLLAPHSQGCLYANAVYQALNTSTNNLKIVATASTASSVAGDRYPYSSYVTADEDWAIETLRQDYPGTLPANIPSGTPWYWISSHSFTDVYLNPAYSAWPLLKQKIDFAMGSFQPDGAILTTVTWSDPTYNGIDLRMLINGQDTYSQITGADPNITIGGGFATYCSALPASTYPTTFAPMIYNRGTTSQNVTVAGPLGAQSTTVKAQQLLPGVFMAAVMKVQNGAITPYP